MQQGDPVRYIEQLSLVMELRFIDFITCVCVQVQFQVGTAVGGNGLRAVNIISRHAFLRGYVESIKGQGQV